MLLALAFVWPQVARAQLKDAVVKIDSDALDGIRARPIGPAATGGRIAAVTGIPGSRLTVYAGSASGGVWKSINSGMTFKPVFERNTQSIGAIAVDPAHPETVWVGTGEAWVRNSVSVGTGIYKTTDGGENWQAMGLEDSEHISRIVVNPKDSNAVLACALGHLWNSNAERGVFRTTDGGKSWNKTLFVNEDTGCSDLSVDPQDPKIVYAGMWQMRRKPWMFTSGGPGSGLYKSTDGGATWQRLGKGLPEGILGRIGLAVAPSRPNVVYAVVEAKESGLYRSDNLGESWTLMNTGQNIQARPFYFATIVVDPKDYNRVYKPGYTLSVSEDGGKTFTDLGGGGVFGGSYHGDCHALWINPENPDQLFLGTDGGVYSSSDRGALWNFVEDLPVSQFYHVSYDLDRPYNVYGGLQDNGSWMGPSRHTGGVTNRLWDNLGFGDGFWAFPDVSEPDLAYVEWQGGKLYRVVKSTHESKIIQPLAGEGEPELRFNWNTPVHLSVKHPGTLYIGSQYLFRSRDRGESWERISPDLTTNDPEKQKQEQSGGLTVDNSDAEKHCTIYAISESPRNSEVVWAGTDDGNVQVTRDGGKTWANVTSHIPGVPQTTWVSYVDASPTEEGTAYVTFDGHNYGDMKPYVFRTRDFGKNWEALATADLRSYAHVVREDPVNPKLLFVGTEFGLFVSFDGGISWAQMRAGMPGVAVRDIAIHSRDNDLILATHGRGIWIVDDITPLRAVNADLLNSEVAFLPTAPSAITIPAFEQRSDGDTGYSGRSPDATATVIYYLKKRHLMGELRIDVLDSNGKVVYSTPGGRRRGLNRVDWPTRMKPPKAPPARELAQNPYALFGPLLPEGTYTVKMVKGDQTYTTHVELVADPKSTHTAEERRLERETALRIYGMLGRLYYLAEAAHQLEGQAVDRAGKLPANDPLRKRVQALADSLVAVRVSLAANKEGAMTGEVQLREKALALYGSVNGYEGAPTRTQLDRVAVLDRDLQKVAADLDAAASKEVPALNALLEKRKLSPLKPLSEDEWQNKQKD
ncbi:MAG: VPS10 domain-containing protein [Candidatus Acidiferrales bacterium]